MNVAHTRPLSLSVVLFGTLLLSAPEAYSGQSLDTAVNAAVNDGCTNLNPVGANLVSFCSDGGAANSSTGGTITSQTSIDGVERQVESAQDVTRVDLGAASAFLALELESHDKDETAIEGEGFESDRTAMLIGLDYLVNDSLNLGVAVNYAKTDGDFDGEVQEQDSGGFENSSHGLMIFGDYSAEAGAYVGWSLGYNAHDYKTERYSTVTMGTNDANGLLESVTDANEVNAGVEVGFDITGNLLNVGPRFALRYKHLDIDGYTETVKRDNPAGTDAPLALIVDDQTEKSFTSHLGVQLSKAINWDYGVLMPQLYLDYVHEFEDRQRDITFAFVGDDPSAGNTFTFNNDRPDQDYGNVLLGLVAVFPGGLQSAVSYERLLEYSDHENEKFNVSVRLEF